MKAQMLEKLNDYKRKSGKSLEAVHESLGYATSTVQRWLKGESNPDIEQLESLVEFFGGSMKDLYAAVGKQEMVATENIGYQGAEVMIEHYEQRLKAKDEKYELLRDHHDQRIKEINESHKRSVDYLLKEKERMEKELDLANKAAVTLAEAAKSYSGKKHTVFWVMVGVNVLLAILLAIALFTGPII